MVVEREDFYRKIPLEKIPWNIETLPDAWGGWSGAAGFLPCRTMVFGCGDTTIPLSVLKRRKKGIKEQHSALGHLSRCGKSI